MSQAGKVGGRKGGKALAQKQTLEEKQQRGFLGAHVRWHKSKWNPLCAFCTKEQK